METTIETRSWASWMIEVDEEHEPRDSDAFIAFLQNEHKQVGELVDENTYLEKLEEFNHFYIGYYNSFEEFVEEDIRENHDQEIPDWLDCHIDWESFARDYQYSGDYWHTTVQGDVHVFRTF